MLNLDCYGNQRDIFVVDFYGKEFRSYVSAVKSLPSSVYKPAIQKWFIKVYDYPILIKELNARQLNHISPTENFTALIKSYQDWEARTKELLALEDAQVPEVEALLKHPLMKHQRVACKVLLERKILLLADQMGVGKTLPAIASAQYLRTQGIIKSVLVICTASTKGNWTKEMDKFLIDPDYAVIEGTPSARGDLYSCDAFFKVVNYELLRRDIEAFEDDMTYDLIISDEVHRIRNHTALQSKAVTKLGKKVPYRWGLTGTPVHNKMEDLFAVMKFVKPDMFGTWWHFDKRYIERGFFGEVTGYKNREEIRDKLGLIMLRRRKEDVLGELPPKIYNNIYVEMSKAQRKFYDAVVNQNIYLPANQVAEDLINDANPLAKTTYAREVCDSTELVDQTSRESAKLKELKEVLDEFIEDGRKVVVFTQFAKMGAIIQREIKHPSVFLHGGVSTQNDVRQDMIDKFTNDPALPVLITTTAGGEGINLQCAEVIIFFDLPFNPQIIAQVEDRLHRKGQLATVNVVRLIAKDTVEERVLEILEEKQELFDALIENDMVLSTKEILKLL